MGKKTKWTETDKLWINIATILMKNGIQMIMDLVNDDVDTDSFTLSELKERLAAVKRPPIKK